MGPAADRCVRRAARRAAQLSDQLDTIDEDTRRFLIACADAAAPHWTEKDQGIWEVRGDPQHFLYSKVMCWVALDRAIALADRLGATDRVDGWKQQREEIWETVVRDGWNEQANAFTQYVGSTALDASNLMMAIVGFLPATDPRMLATIDAIEERLTDDRGLVFRYLTEDGVDGLAGDEGTFLLCTFWLAQALAHGRPGRSSARGLRAGRRLRQRRRPARGRGRPDDWGAARQLPAGLQPHRPGECRLGDLGGRAASPVLIMCQLPGCHSPRAQACPAWVRWLVPTT